MLRSGRKRFAIPVEDLRSLLKAKKPWTAARELAARLGCSTALIWKAFQKIKKARIDYKGPRRCHCGHCIVCIKLDQRIRHNKRQKEIRKPYVPKPQKVVTLTVAQIQAVRKSLETEPLCQSKARGKLIRIIADRHKCHTKTIYKKLRKFHWWKWRQRPPDELASKAPGYPH
jgi:hypothetical protein